MTQNTTLEQLRQLKLGGMYEAYKQQLEQPLHQDLSFDERLALLVDRESLTRQNRRVTSLLKKAKLRQTATLEAIDYSHPRGLDKSQIASLASCDFIRHHHNLLITGATGSGKSFIACALGHQACAQGFRVHYIRLTSFLEDIAMRQADGSYAQYVQQLIKVDVLILDDFGLPPKLTVQQSKTLFNILDDRHQIRSTLITSQLPVAHWYDYITEPHFADAILDRLLQNAHRITFKEGVESMRKSKYLAVS